MNKYMLVDVWWCGKCEIEWTYPSVPHQNTCPKCGTPGWWRRFYKAGEKLEGRGAVKQEIIPEEDLYYYDRRLKPRSESDL